MRKLLLILIFLFLWMSVPLQADDFKKALRDYRKATIKMCAQLQAGAPEESKDKLINEIEALDMMWADIKKAYAENPPKEYEKDPAWKGYFTQVEENNSVLKSFVEKGKYKSSVRFCGMNCKLFVKMEDVNGLKSLTSELFTLRDQAKTIKAMLDAKNTNGAVEKAKEFKKTIDSIKEGKLKNADEKDAKALINASDNFFKSVKDGMIDYDTAIEKFNDFMKVFAPIYYNSL